MAFFTSAITTLQTLVVALGAGVGVWGLVNLLEGYGNDNPGANVSCNYAASVLFSPTSTILPSTLTTNTCRMPIRATPFTSTAFSPAA